MKDINFRLVWRAEIEAHYTDPFRVESNAEPPREHGWRTPRTVKVDDVPMIYVQNRVTGQMLYGVPDDLLEHVGRDLSRHALHEMQRSGWVENKIGLAIPKLIKTLATEKRLGEERGERW